MSTEAVAAYLTEPFDGIDDDPDHPALDPALVESWNGPRRRLRSHGGEGHLEEAELMALVSGAGAGPSRLCATAGDGGVADAPQREDAAAWPVALPNEAHVFLLACSATCGPS